MYVTVKSRSKEIKASLMLDNTSSSVLISFSGDKVNPHFVIICIGLYLFFTISVKSFLLLHVYVMVFKGENLIKYNSFN